MTKYSPALNSVATAKVRANGSYENWVNQTTLPTRTNTFKYRGEAKIPPIADSAIGKSKIEKGNELANRGNADGMRVEQVSSQGTRRYVYDGSTIIAETDGSGTILTYFLPGVGFVTGTSQFYYRDNALGSNLATLNSTGAVQSLSEYDGYGIEYTVQAGANTQFRFAGKHGYQTDADTGLDLLGARYYAPKLGRFLTQDPIGHEAGLNLYAYCGNNPLVSVDPDGLQMRKVGRLLGKPQQLMYEHLAGLEASGQMPLGAAEAFLEGNLFSMLTAAQKAQLGMHVVAQALRSEGIKQFFREVALDVTIDGVTTRIQADFAWFDKNGNLRIAEVKTGPRASYTPNQRQILPNLLEANGGQRAIIRSAKIPGKYGKAINVILDRITRVRM